MGSSVDSVKSTSLKLWWKVVSWVRSKMIALKMCRKAKSKLPWYQQLNRNKKCKYWTKKSEDMKKVSGVICCPLLKWLRIVHSVKLSPMLVTQPQREICKVIQKRRLCPSTWINDAPKWSQLPHYNSIRTGGDWRSYAHTSVIPHAYCSVVGCLWHITTEKNTNGVLFWIFAEHLQ